jgi:hypothetical protein
MATCSTGFKWECYPLKKKQPTCLLRNKLYFCASVNIFLEKCNCHDFYI